MVNIIVNSDPKYPINQALIESTIIEVLDQFKVSGKVEIGVSVIGDRQMHQINKKFRGIDQTTNILTFVLDDELPVFTKFNDFAHDDIKRLGDIVLSYPQMFEDSLVNGTSVEDELHSLIEHGVKHLLGQHRH